MVALTQEREKHISISTRFKSLVITFSHILNLFATTINQDTAGIWII